MTLFVNFFGLEKDTYKTAISSLTYSELKWKNINSEYIDINSNIKIFKSDIIIINNDILSLLINFKYNKENIINFLIRPSLKNKNLFNNLNNKIEELLFNSNIKYISILSEKSMISFILDMILTKFNFR